MWSFFDEATPSDGSRLLAPRRMSQNEMLYAGFNVRNVAVLP